MALILRVLSLKDDVTVKMAMIWLTFTRYENKMALFSRHFLAKNDVMEGKFTISPKISGFFWFKMILMIDAVHQKMAHFCLR
jgi:hypothetical protein